MSQKWKILNSQKIFQNNYFSLRTDKCELPNNVIMPRYYVMEFPNWVHVVPFTEKNEIVLLKQYRHPTQKRWIEIPGGTIHGASSSEGKKKSSQKESPKEAAQRELLEETGFQAQKIKKLGCHYPNPALQTNKIHVFLALGCKKIAEPSLDPYEDLKVVLWNLPRLFTAIRKNQIKHSLMIPSIMMALYLVSPETKKSALK